MHPVTLESFMPVMHLKGFWNDKRQGEDELEWLRLLCRLPGRRPIA